METTQTKSTLEELETKQNATLEQLAADTKKQRKHERTQAAMSVIRTVATLVMCAVICYVVFALAPRVTALLNDVDQITQDIQAMNLPEVAESVTTLATEGTEGINTALEDVSRAIGVLEKLDIDGLNKSISDLGAVVEPMAKLFGKR